MILTIVAIILTLLILRQLGLFKRNAAAIGAIAQAGVLFLLVRGALKVLAPIFMILSSVFIFDCIIWVGVHVFCHHEYTLATWRFFRSVFMGMAF